MTADELAKAKYDELLSQVEDCNPGYDMSCGRCKACRRRDRGMRGHPECLTCAGSGFRDDTLGNSKTCWCTWDEKLIAELDQIAEINKRRLTDQNQMTDWDL